MLKLIARAGREFKKSYYILLSAIRRHDGYRYSLTGVNNYRPGVLPVTWLTLFTVARGFTFFHSKEQRKEKAKTSVAQRTVENLISEADELYNENMFKETVDVLSPYKDGDNVEILWRLSRVLYNLSKVESSEEEKKRLVFEAYDLIDRALKLNDSNFAIHKWYSILLDLRASYDGIKARIGQLENVKNHMKRAIDLNPKDATTLHMLGFWCYNISAMPWYQRRIASTLFAAPPVSSFEEALFYFEKAEEVDPNFYSQNLLMLGKTYIQLKKQEKARFFLRLTNDYPARTDDDLQAKKEAAELLKNLEK